jgi:TP901 family phage tail tape measure protein
MAGEAENVISIILRAKNQATAEINAAASQLEGFAARANRLGTDMQVAGAKMMATGGLVAGFIGVATRSAMEYGGATRALVTGAGESQAAIGQVSAGILAMAGEVGTGPTDLAKGMYMIESAGLRGSAGLEVLRASAMGARVGMTDMATMSNVVTSGLNAYGLGGDQAVRVTNTLIATVANGKMQMSDLAASLGTVLPAASAAGVSLAEVGAAVATMTMQGTDAATATTQLRMMLVNLQSAKGPAEEALAGIGLTSREVGDTLTTQGLLPALKLVQEHLDTQLPRGSAAANEALIKIFGGTRSGSAALQIMNGNLGTLEQNLTATGAAWRSNSGAVTGWDLVSKSAGMSLDRLKATIASTVVTLGQGFTGALTIAGAAILPILQSIGTWIGHNQQAVASIMLVVAALLLGGGAASIFAGTVLKVGVVVMGLGASAVSASAGILRFLGSLIILAAQMLITTAHAISMATAWVINQLAMGGIGSLFSNLIGVLASAGSAFLSMAGSVIAGTAAMLGPILLGIAIVGLLYVAWQNNFMGIRDVTDKAVTWIVGKLSQFGEWINRVLKSLGMATVDWAAGWEKIKGTVTGTGDAIGGVLDNFKTGGIAGALGINNLALPDIGQQWAEQTNLPPGTLPTLPGGGESGGNPLSPIIQDTGTKMSDLASAAQSAIGSIQGMAQSAIDASIALGAMPGVEQMKPGANGPFENIYRLQDVAKLGGASPWQAKLGGVSQEDAARIVTEFQKGMLMLPEVLKYIDVEKFRTIIGEKATGEGQLSQFANLVGGDPELIQKMLGGQGLKVTAGQAGVLAEAAKAGTLEQIAKGSMDNVLATGAVKTAVDLGSAAIVTAINARNTPYGVSLPPVAGTAAAFPTLMGALAPGTKPLGLGVANQVTAEDLTSFGAALSGFTSTFGPHPLSQILPMAPPEIVGPYTPATAAGTQPQWTTAGGGPMPVTIVNPEAKSGMTATVPAGGATNTISVTVSPGAVTVGGAGATPGFAERIGDEISRLLQSLTEAESRRSQQGPVLPHQPGTRDW